MKNHNLAPLSELVSFAGYDPVARVLYLTYKSGAITIAYRDVAPDIWEELCRSDAPDLVIQFRIQSVHAFRRLPLAHTLLQQEFVK